MNLVVRAAREEAGLTVEEAAYAIGVTKGTWSNIESRKRSPSLTIAFRMRWLFGRSIEELFEEVVDDSAEFDADQEYLMRLNKVRKD